MKQETQSQHGKKRRNHRRWICYFDYNFLEDICKQRKKCLEMVERRIDILMEIFEINLHSGEAKGNDYAEQKEYMTRNGVMLCISSI